MREVWQAATIECEEVLARQEEERRALELANRPQTPPPPPPVEVVYRGARDATLTLEEGLRTVGERVNAAVRAQHEAAAGGTGQQSTSRKHKEKTDGVALHGFVAASGPSTVAPCC